MSGTSAASSLRSIWEFLTDQVHRVEAGSRRRLNPQISRIHTDFQKKEHLLDSLSRVNLRNLRISLSAPDAVKRSAELQSLHLAVFAPFLDEVEKLDRAAAVLLAGQTRTC